MMREGLAEGGRRFQREGPIMEKDLDMAVVVLVRGHRAPACPGSVEDEGMVYCYYGVLKHYQEF